jgi:hypothetical protein
MNRVLKKYPENDPFENDLAFPRPSHKSVTMRRGYRLVHSLLFGHRGTTSRELAVAIVILIMAGQDVESVSEEDTHLFLWRGSIMLYTYLYIFNFLPSFKSVDVAGFRSTMKVARLRRGRGNGRYDSSGTK